MSKAAEGFFVGTDTLVTIKGLKDAEGAWVNDADLVGVMRNRQGQAVAGCDQIPFFHTPNTNGDYEAILPASAPLKDRAEYDLVVTCNRGGRRMTLVIRRTAVYLQG